MGHHVQHPLRHRVRLLVRRLHPHRNRRIVPKLQHRLHPPLVCPHPVSHKGSLLGTVAKALVASVLVDSVMEAKEAKEARVARVAKEAKVAKVAKVDTLDSVARVAKEVALLVATTVAGVAKDHPVALSSTNVVNLWKVAFNTVAKEARVVRVDIMKEDSVARVAKVALALALPLVMVAREAKVMAALPKLE